MNEPILDTMDTEEQIELEELLAISGLVHEEVIELVEFGVFQASGSGPVMLFHSRTILLARRAARLRDDFGLNPAGMALALTYLERIESLEQKLHTLEACLPR